MLWWDVNWLINVFHCRWVDPLVLGPISPMVLPALLTHWGGDKMDHISQTMFSNAFSWMKMFEYRLRFHWILFLGIRLTIFQHWFRLWLGASQVTSHYLNQWWLKYWRIYASFGLNELTLNMPVPYKYGTHQCVEQRFHALERHLSRTSRALPTCVPLTRAAVRRRPRNLHSHASRGSGHFHAFTGRSSAHFHAIGSRSSMHFHAIRSCRSANSDGSLSHAFPHKINDRLGFKEARPFPVALNC